MENRKRNVQIIVRVTEEKRALIKEKMKQVLTMNLMGAEQKADTKREVTTKRQQLTEGERRIEELDRLFKRIYEGSSKREIFRQQISNALWRLRAGAGRTAGKAVATE